MVPTTFQNVLPPAELNRLNRMSLTHGTPPHTEIDWEDSTTDEEFDLLYPSWSLLAGTGKDRLFDAEARVKFVKYQQINLMAITALLERHGIVALAKLFDLDRSQPFAEYVGHFIKEETYHYVMFMRAIDKIHSTMPTCRPLPTRQIDFAMRWMFRFFNVLPGRKLRSLVTLTVFQFAEQVTIYAHQMVQSRISRPESLIRQVWGFHAQEEVRHLSFDAMVIERYRLWGPFAGIPHLVAFPCLVMVSALLNANEIWAARQLGARVGYWQIPWLMARTEAPFKRRVFRLLWRVLFRASDE